MKIENINIKNFKGIRSYEVDIQGKHVYLVGANASGKSSFIDAVWVGLTGKNIPPTPITDDGKRGQIEIDLGDFIARTKFKKGRPAEFELENKTFTEESEKFIKAPRSFMEKKLGILNFDINEFFNKTDAEKVKYFSKIMNEDFTDIDSEIEEITESRKFDKRKLAELGAKDTYYDEELAKKDPVSVVELSRQIDFEKERAATFEKVDNGVKERKSKAAEIRAKIAELERGLEQVDGEVIDGEKWLENEDNKPKTEYIAELQKEIQDSETINAKIREAKEAKKADDTAEQLKTAIQTANDEIDELKAKKAERISKSIKIDGLEYNTAEERFLWNGLPFDPKQTNTAAQLIAGMKIGSTLLNELKILKVDASLIDKVNFDEVLAWADDNEIELFVELVDREATKLEIIVQDPNEY
jgi:predicted ATP-dependent endonuclease of OLD family